MTPPPLALRPIILKAFAFAQAQPVIYPVAFWLIAVPGFFLTIIDRIMPSALPNNANFPILAETTIVLSASIVIVLLLVVLIFWGYASMLLLCKRLVTPKQGRSRSSFRAVRREALSLVLPLLFTNILRGIFILYRTLLYILPAIFFAIGMEECRGPFVVSLETLRSCSVLWILFPLLIPAIIYFLRTTVADMAVVSDDLDPREALKRSKELIRGPKALRAPHRGGPPFVGRSWHVLRIFIALNLLFFGPPFIIGWLTQFLLSPVNWKMILLNDAIINLLIAGGTIFYLPSMMILFSALRGTTKEV